MAKIDFGKVFDETFVGSIQLRTAEIVDKIIEEAQKGERPLDEVIRFADCSALGHLSEETPAALPLGDGDKTIGLVIQGNEFVEPEEGDDDGHWTTFDIITVEVPAFQDL